MSNFFEMYNITDYSFDNKNYFYLRDFTNRVKVDDLLSTSDINYYTYNIVDGERPEDVAFKFYANSLLHWIILSVNNIIDPIEDWCLSYYQITEIAQAKYTNIYDTHHFEDINGLVYDNPAPALPAAVGLYAVSNLQYEINKNEANRSIKILRPELVNQFINQFATQIAL